MMGLTEVRDSGTRMVRPYEAGDNAFAAGGIWESAVAGIKASREPISTRKKTDSQNPLKDFYT
jgi:hypothetical protein